MVFLVGVPFAESLLVKKALERFYGIGAPTSQSLMARFHIHKLARLSSLKEQQLLELNSVLSNMKLENELRRQLRDNIKKLRDIGAYRGRRHAAGLPVRGQTTKSQISSARKLNRIDRAG